MKTFYSWLENQEPNDIKQQIMNDPIPDNLKNLYRAVFKYNKQSEGNTLFHLMPKYDNMKLPMLDSHGIAKVNLGFQLNSLIRLLQAGKMPSSMFSAPLTRSPEYAGSSAGAGTGTGSGTAYRDGSFIIVAPPGKTLHEEIKYVIVDGSVADANFNENGMTPTQLLQKELGQGKYVFIDGGEKNNQLDGFFSKMQQYKPQPNIQQQQQQQPTQQPQTNKPFSLSSIADKMGDPDWHQLYDVFARQIKLNPKNPQTQELGKALYNWAQGNKKDAEPFLDKYVRAQKIR